jgi:hypothetical protein
VIPGSDPAAKVVSGEIARIKLTRGVSRSGLLLSERDHGKRKQTHEQQQTYGTDSHFEISLSKTAWLWPLGRNRKTAK